LSVQVTAGEGGLLTFHYSLHAELSGLRIPERSAGGRADGLWKHTCFEAFITPASGGGYVELNVSPAHDWAIYDFSSYRSGMSPASVTEPPEITTRRAQGVFELQAAVRASELAPLRDMPRLRIALAAVIEEHNGRLSYWALKHAPGKPDFHHPHGFVLDLEIP
jgi:hypothetical protein